MRPTPAGAAFIARTRRALAEAAVAAARGAAGPEAVRYAVPDYERGVALCHRAVATLDTGLEIADARPHGGAFGGASGDSFAGPGPGAAAAAADAAATFGPDLAFAPLFPEDTAFALLPADHPLARAAAVDPGDPAHRAHLHRLPLASFGRAVAPALYARVEDALGAAGPGRAHVRHLCAARGQRAGVGVRSRA